ncbi:MAG: hypothetical protein ACK522_10860 [Synechococcaceae cyanobacterium]
MHSAMVRRRILPASPPAPPAPHHRPALLATVVAAAIGSALGSGNAFAQTPTGSPTCPLPAEIAATFLQSTCSRSTLTAPQTFYRYFSSDSNRKGRYLTTDQFRESSEVIRKLALNQAWGNQAKRQLSVTLPAGTVIYQGVVAPQAPSDCYPGGGQQTFIENSKDPAIVWTDGPDLGGQPFSCPSTSPTP